MDAEEDDGEITEMSEAVLEIYEEVKDKVSKEDFLARMNEFRKENTDIGFYNDVSFADMVKGEFVTEKNETLSESEKYSVNTISQLEDGKQDINISGFVDPDGPVRDDHGDPEPFPVIDMPEYAGYVIPGEGIIRLNTVFVKDIVDQILSGHILHLLFPK